MSTAVTVPTPEEGKAAKAVAAAPSRSSFFQVHKPGEGYATRLAMMAVVFAYVLYACYHWYYDWVTLRDVLPSFLTDWTLDNKISKAIAWAGTAAIALVGSLVGYYYIYIKRESAEFLIKTDGELAKVTWPKIAPWFRADTQVWGATYVVLLVVFALTVYVFGVDFVLQWVAQKAFYASNR